MAPSNSLLKLNIAGYSVHSVPTGQFGLDGGAMFGTVPKVLWQKTNPADENNRIVMEARALLLVGHGRTILIDTGNGGDFSLKYGEKLGAKFTEMYAINPDGPNLLGSLKKHGITPEKVTDVILTHLHFDHAGGATTTGRDGELAATFPRARYYVQRANFENASRPNIRERASYFAANFEPLIKSGHLVITAEDKIPELPNITLHVSNGHTVGHQVVIVEDEFSRLIYCGDVIPTSTHVRSAWVMGYDLDPLKLMEEKSELLNKSLTKPTYYFFEHDPYCDVATVEPERQDFKVRERFWID